MKGLQRILQFGAKRGREGERGKEKGNHLPPLDRARFLPQAFILSAEGGGGTPSKQEGVFSGALFRRGGREEWRKAPLPLLAGYCYPHRVVFW